MKNGKSNIYVYDLETYPNFFIAVFKNIHNNKFYEFEISDRVNKSIELYNFLKQKKLKLIGFNNINFDYPILHNTILKYKKVINNKLIYDEVEKIIKEKYSAIPDKYTVIPQLDLYKIWHYDNKNKATSLKWLEFAMRWENVEDLPYEPGTILTNEQMDKVSIYCRNDINATEEFFKKSSKHIQIRQFYSNLENINLINASEIKISKEIFSKHLAKEMNMSKYSVQKLRTERDRIEIKDVIFDYIKFDDEINNNTLNFYKNSIWINTSEMSKKQKEKYAIKHSIKYKNIIREYAEGGLHSFGKPGIYKSDNKYVLVDVDFASFYPHICFKNNLHPKHIPENIFNKLYEGFYKERKNYPKSDPRNYVLKIILNGSYGLSKDKYSFLYDPKWQLAITINGQLLLTKLTELVYQKCKKEVKIIFENTDGAMYKIHRSDLNMIKKACSEMEKICNIPLEIQECDKIIARDVNNYINVINNENIKFKGCFEIDRDYHKNHSKRIVPITLANYFLYNTPVEQYIKNYIDSDKTNILKGKNEFYINHKIYDFCLGAKMKGSNLLYKRIINKKGITDINIGKMNRYYVSNTGNDLIKKLPPLEKDYLTETEKFQIKHYGARQMNIFDEIEDIKIEPKDRETNIESGWKCTLFNKYSDKNDYNINYEYYIRECNKIIKAIENE